MPDVCVPISLRTLVLNASVLGHDLEIHFDWMMLGRETMVKRLVVELFLFYSAVF